MQKGSFAFLQTIHGLALILHPNYIAVSIKEQEFDLHPKSTEREKRKLICFEFPYPRVLMCVG